MEIASCVHPYRGTCFKADRASLFLTFSIESLLLLCFLVLLFDVVVADLVFVTVGKSNDLLVTGAFDKPNENLATVFIVFLFVS